MAAGVRMTGHALADLGGVDLVFDAIGGDILRTVRRPNPGWRNTGDCRRADRGRAADGLAVDFVVEPDRAQLKEIVQRVGDGRLRTNIGNVMALDDAAAALNPTERRKGKTITHVRP
jgi:NADPH:quinone reductase-like Zn-dependent oxidoreductase